MARYIVRRLLWMIPIILGVAILIFTILYFSPGDPAASVLGQGATAADIERQRELMGLNAGFFERLLEFLTNTFVRFDFGNSYITKDAVIDQLISRLPRTLMLASLAMIMGLIIGVPLGTIAALKQDTWIDRSCMAFSFLGVSMPNFWLAILLVLLFSVKLKWLPPMGLGSLKHYIMPTLAGGVGGIAMIARQTRSAMLEVIRCDYVTTAKSKGLKEIKIIFRHELSNALIPIITAAGTLFGTMLGGTLIIEQIFTIPAMGSYLSTAVFNRDYPIILSGGIFIALAFSLVILLIDLLYAFVDPRIKAQYEGKPLFKKRPKKGGA